MDDVRTPRASLRVLVLSIVVAMAAGAGVLAGEAFPEAAAEPATVAEAPALDVDPIAQVAATLVDALQADLPVPTEPPSNPREATPALQHGQLEIPSIGLSQPFFEGVSLTAIDRGPSHWPGTAMPGQLGNVVVAGHRTTRTRPFWDLDLVQPGDELVFTMSNGERFVYALERTEVVDDQDIHIIDQSYGYRATLFGCHPKGSAAKRIVGHFVLKDAIAPGTTDEPKLPPLSPL